MIIFILNKYFGFNVEKQILGKCFYNIKSEYDWKSGELFYKY